MLVIWLPLIVCILGLVVYLASTTNPKLAELGRIAFACGLLVTVWLAAAHVVRF